jgi:hypothetical protein
MTHSKLNAHPHWHQEDALAEQPRSESAAVPVTTLWVNTHYRESVGWTLEGEEACGERQNSQGATCEWRG